MIVTTDKGKPYSLESMETVFSEDILNIVKKYRYRIITGSDRTVYQRIDGLKKWVDYLKDNKDGTAQFLQTFRVGQRPLENDWLTHRIQLSRHFQIAFPSITTRQKHISAVNWWLKFFSDFGIAPQANGLPHPDLLTEAHMDVRPKGKKKTVIDYAVPDSLSSVNIPEKYQEYISDYIDSVAKDDPDGEEKISLLVNAVYEIAMSDSPSSLDSFSKLVEEAIARRLVRIRNRAESAFTKALEKRSYWISEAKKGKEHYNNIIKWLDWEKKAGEGNTNPYTASLDNLSNDEVLQSFLYCLVEKESPYYGVGFRYSFLPRFKYNRIRKYLQKRNLRVVAQDFVEMVGASKELLVSAQVILVDELNANPSSVRQLKRDDVVKFSEDLIETSWVKARANYKRLGLVELALSEGDEWRAAHATIDELKKATEPYSGYAIPENKGNLFLYNYQNSTGSNRRKQGNDVVSTPSENWFNECTQALLSDVAEGLTARSIRASRILLEGLQKGLASAKAKGRHVTELVTRKHYLDKLAYSKKLEDDIRVFMEWLEALIVVDIEDYAIKAGYDEKKFASLQQKIKEDGFGGIVCKDPNAGYQKGTVAGDGCGLFLKCLTCKQRSSVFFANKQNITQMILWSRALASYVKPLNSKEASKFYMWCQFIDTIYEELQGDLMYSAILAESENAADHYEAKYENPYTPVLKGM
ncbi:hypothetical protein [Marisediminitalea sp.]|tara:strand:+ start:3101 stop:5191 length:2091 start_codon:yes stop_codon:yes gene_type:complete